MHHDDTTDDAALIALTLAGDRDAFGPLLLRYYSSVVRLCRRLLGPTLEAQDVAQEAALQAFLDLGRLREPDRFGAWLHAIAANLARMALRRRRARSIDAIGDDALIALGSASARPPEDVHAAREIHDEIVAALRELSLVNRTVVIGFYLEGYSYAELAELLGVPVSTIKGRLFKGRRQLRQALEPVAHEVLKPDRRPRKERAMTSPELVEVVIDSVQTIPEKDNHTIVLLRVQAERLALPIWIGDFEGGAIAMALEGRQSPRPMTHDLALRMLEAMGAQVQRVVVNNLSDKTFFAEILLEQGELRHSLDARPSDALALAARTGARVFAARSVLDQAALPDDETLQERLRQDRDEGDT